MAQQQVYVQEQQPCQQQVPAPVYQQQVPPPVYQQQPMYASVQTGMPADAVLHGLRRELSDRRANEQTALIWMIVGLLLFWPTVCCLGPAYCHATDATRATEHKIHQVEVSMYGGACMPMVGAPIVVTSG